MRIYAMKIPAMLGSPSRGEMKVSPVKVARTTPPAAASTAAAIRSAIRTECFIRIRFIAPIIM